MNENLPSVMDYTVQDSHIKGEYKEYLHRSLFDVNMRLYEGSRQYKKIVNLTIAYMVSIFDKEFHDYPKIKGVSGANLGIPFNIVVVRQEDGDLLIMINPEVVDRNYKFKKVKSNCGSLVLDEPIEVKRHTRVKVSYCGATYRYKRYRGRDFHTVKIEPDQARWFKAPEAFTIQHEIEHNNGITILDKVTKWKLTPMYRGFY